jgi:hypothetical protein
MLRHGTENFLFTDIPLAIMPKLIPTVYIPHNKKSGGDSESCTG